MSINKTPDSCIRVEDKEEEKKHEFFDRKREIKPATDWWKGNHVDSLVLGSAFSSPNSNSDLRSAVNPPQQGLIPQGVLTHQARLYPLPPPRAKPLPLGSDKSIQYDLAVCRECLKTPLGNVKRMNGGILS